MSPDKQSLFTNVQRLKAVPKTREELCINLIAFEGCCKRLKQMASDTSISPDALQLAFQRALLEFTKEGSGFTVRGSAIYAEQILGRNHEGTKEAHAALEMIRCASLGLDEPTHPYFGSKTTTEYLLEAILHCEKALHTISPTPTEIGESRPSLD